MTPARLELATYRLKVSRKGIVAINSENENLGIPTFQGYSMAVVCLQICCGRAHKNAWEVLMPKQRWSGASKPTPTGPQTRLRGRLGRPERKRGAEVEGAAGAGARRRGDIHWQDQQGGQAQGRQGGAVSHRYPLGSHNCRPAWIPSWIGYGRGGPQDLGAYGGVRDQVLRGLVGREVTDFVPTTIQRILVKTRGQVRQLPAPGDLSGPDIRHGDG